MSREDVELLRNLNVPSGMEVTALFRDEELWASFKTAVEPALHPDCRFAWVAWGQRLEREGLEGLREGWLDWFAPWESYISEVEDILDAGDTVVVLARDRGRRADSEAEVKMQPASVLCITDRKLRWADFYANRDEAFEAVGLRR